MRVPAEASAGGGGAGVGWPFVERERELDVIASARRARADVVVFGDAGVGKSRLLAEVADRAVRAVAGLRVVRVTGSPALSPVPLGAFAGVLHGATEGSRFDVLQRAVADLTADGNSSDVLIAVDDAQWLDDTSAALVALSAQGGCNVVATVRNDERCPTSIVKLFQDDSALRVDLEPLDREAVARVLAVALGAPTDSGTSFRLWQVTRGNLLFLRELVRAGSNRGALLERGGIWTWEGPFDAPGVRDLVLARVNALPAPARRVMELVALGAPLGSKLVERLTSIDALGTAEEAGLVMTTRSSARWEVRPAHPLYGEVVREALGTARRAELAGAMARELVATGAQRVDDALRIATLELDSDHAVDPEAFETAARRAYDRADLVLAERLARAAIGVRDDPSTVLLLVTVLYWQSRYDEALELLESETFADASLDQQAERALHQASTLFWGFGCFEEAEARLLAGAAVVGPEHDEVLRGHHSQMLMYAGRTQEAIVVALTLLTREGVGPVARSLALSGILPSLAMCGRLGEADVLVPEGLALAAEVPSDLQYQSGGVLVGAFVSAMFRGALRDIEPTLSALHEDALARPADPFQGVWAMLLGRSSLARDRLAEAVLRLREAAAVLRARDPGQVLPWALASLAQALGATDDARGATETMAELDAVRPAAIRSIDVDVELGRAWAAYARGEHSVGRDVALAVGYELLAAGSYAVAALALHDALRLGVAPGEVLQPLARAAREAEGPVVAAMHAHAIALGHRDLDALLEVADAFEAVDAPLLAAEAAASAAVLAADSGLRARQRDALLRVSALLSECGPVVTPMLAPIFGKASLAPLTRREKEIALMAGRGLSKRQIADLLHLSPRTVGNHINHCYAKLGISSRGELRALLGGFDAEPTHN